MAFFLVQLMTYFDDIKSVAEDMFGADNIDIQNIFGSNPKLVIHWNEIEVSNERDEKHIIYDLYAKVNFNSNANMIGFELARSSLTPDEMKCGYLFSHIPRYSGNIMNYEKPCLGRGPIKRTITTLSIKYDSDIFKLFLVELDRYVRTESISGGPYIRINEISRNYSVLYSLGNINVNTIPNDYIVDLYKYIMKTNPIKPIICDKYQVDFGLMIPLLCKITEYTLEYLRHKEKYYNSDIDKYFVKCSLKDGSIYICSLCNTCIQGDVTTNIFFKGKNVKFKKIGKESNEDIYVVTPDVARGIVILLYRDYFLGGIKDDKQ